MSAVNTQFSVALHVLAGLGVSPDFRATTTQLSNSVNTAPSFVRRIVSKLAKAGLVRTTSGKAGACTLAKAPDRIMLLDVYRAVDAPGPFAIHAYPSVMSCQVSCNIKSSLERTLDKANRALEQSLKETSLAEVIAGLKR